MWLRIKENADATTEKSHIVKIFPKHHRPTIIMSPQKWLCFALTVASLAEVYVLN